MVEADDDDGRIERAARLLRDARHVVVFTGAGVSAESGIPTFRDALTGLWERFDASDLASADAFRRDPALVWGWYEWRRMMVMRAQPNAAHRAIAALAEKVPRLTLVTQNVDDLHERAGSVGPIHLHGSLFARACDVLFSVGTSSVVFPAAQVPVEAHRAGAKVVQVNPNATGLGAIADFDLRGTAARVMAEWVRRAFL